MWKHYTITYKNIHRLRRIESSLFRILLILIMIDSWQIMQKRDQFVLELSPNRLKLENLTNYPNRTATFPSSFEPSQLFCELWTSWELKIAKLKMDTQRNMNKYLICKSEKTFTLHHWQDDVPCRLVSFVKIPDIFAKWWVEFARIPRFTENFILKLRL